MFLNAGLSLRGDRTGYLTLAIACAGFLGNFGLSLLGHAQNGFYYWTEWLSVGSGALAVGFLFIVLNGHRSQHALQACLAILGLQIVVGLLAFGLWDVSVTTATP